MKYLLTLLVLTSCAQFDRRPVFKSKLELRDEKIERCVHLLIDKGVKFTEAATMCSEKIYEKHSI